MFTLHQTMIQYLSADMIYADRYCSPFI